MSASTRRDEGSVREGEELDATAVDAWLKQRLPHLEGTPAVTQYSGGASNWTYRLRYANDDLVLRRPPAGTKAEVAHDMAPRVPLPAGAQARVPLRARDARPVRGRERASAARST